MENTCWRGGGSENDHVRTDGCRCHQPAVEWTGCYLVAARNCDDPVTDGEVVVNAFAHAMEKVTSCGTVAKMTSCGTVAKVTSCGTEVTSCGTVAKVTSCGTEETTIACEERNPLPPASDLGQRATEHQDRYD